MTTQPPKTLFPEPPEHLSPRSKTLWQEIAPHRARSIERRTLFQAALEALDRADEARQVIRAEGMIATTATTGAAHAHPAAKVEREARSQFVKIWDMLNLGWNREVDGL